MTLCLNILSNKYFTTQWRAIKNLIITAYSIVVEYHFSGILVEYCKFYFELINTFKKCMQLCVYDTFFLRYVVLKRIKE